MGILSSILTLPLAPVRGVIALGELIQRRVDEEMHDPATTRRQLEELQDARQRGEISAEEEKEAQEEILKNRVLPTTGERTPPEDG
jgi:hypothetical protein